MDEGEVAQNALALGGQADEDLARILGIGQPGDETEGLEPVDQTYGAVVLQQEARRDMADGGRPIGGLEDEQRLMLLRLDVRGAGGGLTEAQETANLEAEFLDALVFGQVEVAIGPGHIHIVSRYIYKFANLVGWVRI